MSEQHLHWLASAANWHESTPDQLRHGIKQLEVLEKTPDEGPTLVQAIEFMTRLWPTGARSYQIFNFAIILAWDSRFEANWLKALPIAIMIESLQAILREKDPPYRRPPTAAPARSAPTLDEVL